MHTLRADIVSLPPSSDIPDTVVKGRGALLARKGHFTAAIRNVLTLLEPYKSLVIMSQIRSYLGSCHATAACLASFAGLSGGDLLRNVMNTEGLVEVCLFYLQNWKTFELSLSDTCSIAG